MRGSDIRHPSASLETFLLAWWDAAVAGILAPDPGPTAEQGLRLLDQRALAVDASVRLVRPPSAWGEGLESSAEPGPGRPHHGHAHVPENAGDHQRAADTFADAASARSSLSAPRLLSRKCSPNTASAVEDHAGW